MRPPLDRMIIRRVELERRFAGPQVTERLSSSLGGAYGRVRAGGSQAHQGWDLYASIGTTVYAVAKGTVDFVALGQASDVGLDSNYGRQLKIRLDPAAIPEHLRFLYGSLFAFYAHLSEVFVSFGDSVEEGAWLGRTGSSGNAKNTPPHLHFEVHTREGRVGRGFRNRIDPGDLLGYEHYSCRASDWEL